MLCSCSSKITQGEVYDKVYKQAKTCVQFIPVVHTDGQSTYTTLIPYCYYYPERYEIHIKQMDNNGEYQTAKYYVTESVFNEINIGDEFVYDSERDYDEEPYTREVQQ